MEPYTLIKSEGILLPSHNFQGLNGYRARESGERVVVVVEVVGLSIVMPTTKQLGKVEVGFGFGNKLALY